MKTLLLILTLTVIGSSQSFAQGDNIYTVSPYEDSLWLLDTTTFTVISSIQLTTTVASTVSGCNGITIDPCSGAAYIAFKDDVYATRGIGSIDLTTGIITPLFDTGDNIAGIDLVNDSILVAVIGDGGTLSETVTIINLNTQVMVPLGPSTGAGSDGESVAFCTDNNKAYRWSGRNTNPAMESWDLTGTAINIPLTGFNFDEVFGATYIGSGNFLLANLDQEFIVVDTTGFATLLPIGTGANYYKGLAFAPPSIGFDMAMTDSICPYGDSTLLVGVGADTYEWYLDGTAIAGATNDSLWAMTSGDYTCEITKGTTCSGFVATTLTVSSSPIELATLSNLAPSFCAGDSVTIFDATTTGVSSEWLTGGMIVDNDSSYTSMTGETLTYRLYSANGCYDEATVVVTENALPVVMATADQPSYCDGDMITLTASGDPATYTWDNSVLDGVAFMQPISTVTYTVVAVDANLCSDSVQIDVTVNENPSSTSTTVDEILGTDGSIDLTVTGTGPFTFDWDNDGVGDIDDPEDLTGLPAGTYTVIVYGPTGCTFTETVIVGSQVGLNEFGLNASMSIFPNPNTGEFTVTFTEMSTENLSVQIINTLGQVISESEVVNNSLEVDIRDAGAGIYMIRVTDGTNFATENIIVE